MINVYEIGTTLTLRDLITPQLIKLSDEFRKVDAQVLQIGKRLQKMGAEVVGIRNLAGASKNLAASMKAIKDESALAEKNMFALRMALPSGGIGLESELIAANAQARILAGTLAGIRGGGHLLPPTPGAGGGGGGRRGGGHVHGGNLHFGSHGVGVGGVGIGLMSDALVPLGAAMVAGYVGKQFYEGAKDYQDAFMRFKSLNLGDQVNDEADKFVKATRVYGVSQTELMKALGESVGLFGSTEEAKKYTPLLTTLGKANAAVFGGRNGSLDDEGLKSLIKFIDRRGGFKDEASFKRSLDLSERLITGSSGFLKFQDLAAFSQNAGTAFRSLSDEGLLEMEGLLIEQGGQKAGTSWMSLYQNLIAGRTPKKTMGLLQDLGLAKLAMQTHGAVGGKALKSLVMTDIKGSELLQADPPKWMRDVLIPSLQAHGITSESAQLKAVNDIISNRTGSNQGSLMRSMNLRSSVMYNDARNFANQAPGVAEDRTEVHPFTSDSAGLLSFFASRFSMASASDADLEYLSFAADEAANAASALSDHIEGVSCLIDSDRDDRNRCQSGALQDGRDQTRLLCFVASQVATIGRMAYIGSEAAHAQRLRAEARLAALTAERDKQQANGVRHA